jgi:stage V sporulation protein G
MQTSNNFSQVRITLVEKDSLRAIASVKAHDCLFLTGLRVVEGKNGLFVSMPNRKTESGEFQDIYFPASKAVRDELQALVLDAYKKEVTMAVAA